jgi:hypothetical protein
MYRYNDEGRKFDFPRLRIVRGENGRDVSIDVNTVKGGIEGQVGDDKDRYMTLLDRKITRSVVLAPVGRGLWQKAQSKLRHQSAVADALSVSITNKHRKRRKNPRRNSTVKRNSVVSIMSLDNHGSMKRRYSITTVNEIDGDSFKTLKTGEEIIKHTYGGSLEEKIPPQMVRSAYIPTGTVVCLNCFMRRIFHISLVLSLSYHAIAFDISIIQIFSCYSLPLNPLPLKPYPFYPYYSFL